MTTRILARAAADRFAASNLDRHLLRWSLVLVFALFGYSKWFEYEAQGLAPLIGNSPLLSWMHAAFGVRGASFALGGAETSTAVLLAVGTASARASFAGALLAAATFAVTMSLLLTTPGVWEASAGGFPALGLAGGFLLKDTVLFAASAALLRDAAHALRSTAAPARGPSLVAAE